MEQNPKCQIPRRHIPNSLQLNYGYSFSPRSRGTFIVRSVFNQGLIIPADVLQFPAKRFIRNKEQIECQVVSRI